MVNLIKTNLKSRESIIKVVIIFLGCLGIIYIIGLINPITGPQLRYPYYEIYCGHKPIVGSPFTNTYFVPNGGPYYDLMSRADNIGLFCTTEEAHAHGYSSDANNK